MSLIVNPMRRHGLASIVLVGLVVICSSAVSATAADASAAEHLTRGLREFYGDAQPPGAKAPGGSKAIVERLEARIEAIADAVGERTWLSSAATTEGARLVNVWLEVAAQLMRLGVTKEEAHARFPNATPPSHPPDRASADGFASREIERHPLQLVLQLHALMDLLEERYGFQGGAPGDRGKAAERAWLEGGWADSDAHLDAFIACYPGTNAARVALSIRYEVVKRSQDIGGYDDFLVKYRYTKIGMRALDEAYELYRAEDRYALYGRFMERYGYSPHAADASLRAQVLLLELAEKMRDIAPLRQLMLEFPETPFLQRAVLSGARIKMEETLLATHGVLGTEDLRTRLKSAPRKLGGIEGIESVCEFGLRVLDSLPKTEATPAAAEVIAGVSRSLATQSLAHRSAAEGNTRTAKGYEHLLQARTNYLVAIALFDNTEAAVQLTGFDAVVAAIRSNQKELSAAINRLQRECARGYIQLSADLQGIDRKLSEIHTQLERVNESLVAIHKGLDGVTSELRLFRKDMNAGIGNLTAEVRSMNDNMCRGFEAQLQVSRAQLQVSQDILSANVTLIGRIDVLTDITQQGLSAIQTTCQDGFDQVSAEVRGLGDRIESANAAARSGAEALPAGGGGGALGGLLGSIASMTPLGPVFGPIVGDAVGSAIGGMIEGKSPVEAIGHAVKSGGEKLLKDKLGSMATKIGIDRGVLEGTFNATVGSIQARSTNSFAKLAEGLLRNPPAGLPDSGILGRLAGGLGTAAAKGEFQSGSQVLQQVAGGLLGSLLPTGTSDIVTAAFSPQGSSSPVKSMTSILSEVGLEAARRVAGDQMPPLGSQLVGESDVVGVLATIESKMLSGGAVPGDAKVAKIAELRRRLGVVDSIRFTMRHFQPVDVPNR